MFAIIVLAFVLIVRDAIAPPWPTEADARRDGVERRHYSVSGRALTVSYLRKGDPAGRRVIFVHGTPGDATQFERYLAAVPHGAEFIAVDRPGFGHSKPKTAVTSLAQQAAALRPLLIDRGGGWPILVGHSLGGPVIAQVAADNPGKVGGLLILAGALDPKLEHVYAIQYGAEWPGVRDLLPAALRNSNRELIALKGELEKLAPRLARIRCHVAVVHGTSDAEVPYANVAFIKTNFAAAHLSIETVPRQNHYLPENEKARIDQSIATLLRDAPKPC